MHLVKDVGPYVEPGHLLGNALRGAGGGDAGVGDDEDALGAREGQVVADLLRRAEPELELGGAIREDGLPVRVLAHLITTGLTGVPAALATLSGAAT